MRTIRIAAHVAACALLAATGAAALADEPCVSVTESTYTAGNADLGVATVQWQARLANRCNASYDADLKIRFVDAEDKVIYESSDLLAVPRHGTAVAHREFNIPGPDFERVTDVVVHIVAERERPF